MAERILRTQRDKKCCMLLNQSFRNLLVSAKDDVHSSISLIQRKAIRTGSNFPERSAVCVHLFRYFHSSLQEWIYKVGRPGFIYKAVLDLKFLSTLTLITQSRATSCKSIRLQVQRHTILNRHPLTPKVMPVQRRRHQTLVRTDNNPPP